jgi:hypothetical protein
MVDELSAAVNEEEKEVAGDVELGAGMVLVSTDRADVRRRMPHSWSLHYYNVLPDIFPLRLYNVTSSSTDNNITVHPLPARIVLKVAKPTQQRWNANYSR